MARGIRPQSNSSGESQNGHPPQIPESGGIYRTGIAMNTLAIPSPFSENPDIETVEHDGEVLFQYFVQEELEHVGINRGIFTEEQPEASDTATNQTFAQAGSHAAARTPEGYRNTVSATLGRRLRDLADEFSRSREATLVQQEASRVDLNDINEASFLELLRVLFNQGVSNERLIALFFFCTYVLIRAFNEKSGELCKHMFLWSLQFVKNHVCRWVYENGGWGKVLGTVYDIVFKILALSAFAVVILAGLAYIRRPK